MREFLRFEYLVLAALVAVILYCAALTAKDGEVTKRLEEANKRPIGYRGYTLKH